MVRVEDLNITFFHIPKNAGTSIANWLTKYVGGEEYLNDLRHSSPYSITPLFDELGWTFCCVRNTWDRYVSWYNFFVGQKRIDITFNEFMDICMSGDYSAKYFRPMTSQLPTANNVDYIMRYENLIEDFKIIQQKTNCYKPLFKSNQSKRTAYTDYFTNRVHVDWIANYHAEEIEQLKYTYGG